MIQSKKTFLVGFSGGADSTAALLWTAENFSRQGREIIAVHFNHHLRGAESDAEALHAAGFAAERNITFRLIDLDIAPGGNLEARARQARLDEWAKLAAEYENPVVVTGHHQDDCIENLFIRIGRGSNVSGLTGLQRYSSVDGVDFFRPLLSFSREEIEAFLRERGVGSWSVDSSNLDCDYARNVLRNRILPELYRLFPGGRKAAAQTLINLADDAACLENEAFDRYQNGNRCETAFWRSQPRAMTVRMLKFLCQDWFEDRRPLSSGAVENFEKMVQDQRRGICELDGSRRLYFGGGRILPVSDTAETVLWNWRENPEICWGNWHFSVKDIDILPPEVPPECAVFGDALPEVLEIGSPQAGEKMLPFGRKHPVKVKDLRIKRKLPAYPVMPSVRDRDGRTVWLPGVRHSGEYPAEPGSRMRLFFAEKM